LTIQLNFGNSGNLIAPKMQFHLLTGHDDGSPLPADIIQILQTPEDQRNSDQRDRLKSYYATHATGPAPLRVALANAQERLAVLTGQHATMIMAEAESPRKTHILLRGDY